MILNEYGLIEKSFNGKLIQGRPRPIRLEKDQVSYLDFTDSNKGELKVEIEVLLGDIGIQFF